MWFSTQLHVSTAHGEFYYIESVYNEKNEHPNEKT